MLFATLQKLNYPGQPSKKKKHPKVRSSRGWKFFLLNFAVYPKVRKKTLKSLIFLETVESRKL